MASVICALCIVLFDGDLSGRETTDSSCIMREVRSTGTPRGGDSCQLGRQVSKQCLYTRPGTLSPRDLLTFINSIVDMFQNPRKSVLFCDDVWQNAVCCVFIVRTRSGEALFNPFHAELSVKERFLGQCISVIMNNFHR